jgi:polysaccharide export outer membrane protein
LVTEGIRCRLNNSSHKLIQTPTPFGGTRSGGKAQSQKQKMIQQIGNGLSKVKRYSRSGLIAALSALLLIGCSSTPNLQTLEKGSVDTNRSKLSAPPSEPSASAPSASMPESFENGKGDDELPQIQPPSSKYVLGSGDVVTLTVWGHPELSGKRVIGPDGEIQLPFVGSFRVAGLNADDASRKLTSALREDYLNTAASVIVDNYNSNQIIVLGHVAHQGVLTFPGDPTLLEALAKAGAAPGKDAESGMPTRCAIIRGRDRIMWVDLRPLMKGTDISLNMSLHRNDLLFVPDPDDELVYVMGQVKNPGPYPLTANMSFLEALTRAGGPNDNAQQGKIVLARPSKNTEQIVDLENDLKKSGTNYQLEPGDIVYVPKSGLAKLGYVMQQINPITTMALFGATLL